MDGFLKCLRKSIKENKREILMKAEKVIFAEKIVDFLMVKHHDVPYKTNIHDSYRTAVQNHFNESIKNTLDEMDDILAGELEEVLDVLKSANGLDLEHFLQYGIDLYEGYIESTFEARKILYFCVHMARLAVGFYREGVRAAPDFGLHGILYALKFWDMNRGRWMSLNSVAERYQPSPGAVVLKERWQGAVSEDTPQTGHSDRDMPKEREELDSSTSSKGFYKLRRSKKRPMSASKEETDSSGESSADSEDDEYDLLYNLNRVLVSPVAESPSTFHYTSDGSSPASQQSSSHLLGQSGNSSVSSVNDSKAMLGSVPPDYGSRLKKARRKLF